MFGSEEVSLPRVWSILMGRASVPFICFHLFLIPSGHLPSSPSSFSSLSPLLSTSDYLIVRPSLRSCSPLIYFSSLPSLRPSSSSFCLFINVLPVGVPWRQAAKSVTTATHCGLWRVGLQMDAASFAVWSKSDDQILISPEEHSSSRFVSQLVFTF